MLIELRLRCEKVDVEQQALAGRPCYATLHDVDTDELAVAIGSVMDEDEAKRIAFELNDEAANYEELQEELNDLYKQLEEIEETNSDLESDLEDVRGERNILTDELTEARDRIEELENDLAECKELINHARVERCAYLERELDDCKKEIEAWKRETGELEAERDRAASAEDYWRDRYNEIAPKGAGENAS